MRQFRKGRRLVALCAQKSGNVQRMLIRLNAERKNLIEQISQCDSELQSLGEAVIALQINDSSVTRADIYIQRRQLALLLHQRAQVNLERVIIQENVSDIEFDIQMNQKQLAVLKRKEMKFTKWMQQGKKQWTLQQDSIAEDETQEVFPWALTPETGIN